VLIQRSVGVGDAAVAGMFLEEMEQVALVVGME